MNMLRTSLIVITTFLIPLTFVVDAKAGEVNQISEMYMPNDSDGFLTLTDEACRIPSFKEAYPFKALNADDQGHEMEGCWIRPDAPKPFEPIVNVVMYELGSVNIGTFKQHLFSADKKRWSGREVETVKNVY